MALPSAINALTRERESEPIASAKKRSARWPAASGPAVAVKVSAAASGGEGGLSVRALKALVIGMGVLIVAGTVALVAVVVQRAGGVAGGGGARLDLPLNQPEGSRIAGIAAAEGGTLGVWVSRPDGDRVVLVDPRRGRVAGEIRLGR